jgi:outer membrane protein OmpA-like peptidoglycan-associated protein
VADILDDEPALDAIIDGHADESGTSEHNQDLSERRAQAVAEYLQDRGVTATRLTVRGFGELKPLAEDSERSRRNRRVEIRFDSRAVKGETE